MVFLGKFFEWRSALVLVEETRDVAATIGYLFSERN